MKILTKKCIVCGKKFEKPYYTGIPEWKTRKFCSKKCVNIGRNPWNKNKKTGLIPKTAYKKGQHPSLQTEFKKGFIPWNKGMKPDKEWYEKMKKAGFFERRFGEKSRNWKGGTTKLRTAIMALNKYKEWRMKVFKRDNFTCQKCGRKRKKGDRVILEAHHKKQMARIIKEHKIKTTQDAIKCKELWKVKNGETLCISCHR